MLTDANEAVFTFLIRCLNKDKTCSGKKKKNKNSGPCNPNTSIECVTKDVTALFFTNNNERLISILMREGKSKWMAAAAAAAGGAREGAMSLLVVLAPIDKVFKQVVNDRPKTHGAACGVIISTCCICISLRRRPSGCSLATHHTGGRKPMRGTLTHQKRLSTTFKSLYNKAASSARRKQPSVHPRSEY